MFDTYVESGTVLHNYAHVFGASLSFSQLADLFDLKRKGLT